MDTQPIEFEGWYRASHPRLVASLVLVTGDLDLTRDAVDEACARAYARWERVRQMDSPAGWTYRVALNVVRRRQRRRSLERTLLRRELPRSEVPAPAGESWALVRDLPERQRTAVVLRYVADLTQDQIAEAMGITRSTVASTLADAHRRLEALLAEPGDATHEPVKEPEDADLEHLGQPLLDDPPIEPTPVPALAERARRRRARKWWSGIGAAVLVAIVVATAVSQLDDGSDTIHAVGPDDSTTWTVDRPGPASERPHLATVQRLTAPDDGSLDIPALDELGSGRPGPPEVDPVTCIRWHDQRCLETQGIALVTLSVHGEPTRILEVQTYLGPAPWRRYLSHLSSAVPRTTTRVRGHEAIVAPTSGQTGGDIFVQWEEPGANLIVSGPEASFTPDQLVAIARTLRMERATLDSSVAVARIGGPPNRMHRKPRLAAAYSYLTSQRYRGLVPCRYPRGGVHSLEEADSFPNASCGQAVTLEPCLGIGSGTCFAISTRRSSAINGGYDAPVVAGIAPTGTTRIVVTAPDGRKRTFAPADAGPKPRFRYFASRLWDRTPPRVTVTMFNDDGAAVGRATARARPAGT